VEIDFLVFYGPDVLGIRSVVHNQVIHGSFLIVVCPPDLGLLSHFIHGSEYIRVKQFPADASVTSIDVSVLQGLSGLDDDPCDPKILIIAKKGRCGILNPSGR